MPPLTLPSKLIVNNLQGVVLVTPCSGKDYEATGKMKTMYVLGMIPNVPPANVVLISTSALDIPTKHWLGGGPCGVKLKLTHFSRSAFSRSMFIDNV